MAKVLWITDFVEATAPRHIRTRALVQHLSAEHEIHVLALDARSAGSTAVPYRGHQVQGSRIGWWFWRVKKTPWNSYSQAEKCFRIVPKLAHMVLAKFIFPCSMVLHLEAYRKMLRQLLSREDFQVVVLCVAPFTNYVLAAVVKQSGRDVKLSCDIGDPLVENSTKSETDVSLIRRIKQLEGNALLLADCVVVTNSGTKEHFLKHYGEKVDPSDIHVVPNGTPPVALPEDAPADTTEPSCRQLVYAGTFYPKLREPFALFQAVRSLADKDVHLSLYGPRSHFTTGKQVDGRCIEYRGQLSYEEVPLMYQQADILVFIDNAFGVQTPGKIFKLIAARKPLLFIYENEESPTLELIRDYAGAVLCKNDPIDIQSLIDELIEHRSSISYDFDIQPFLWKTRCKEFGRVIDKVMSA